MSKIREAKLTSVNSKTIIAGAKALGYKTTDKMIDFGVSRGSFEVMKNGSIKGDFDYVTKLGTVELPKDIEKRPAAMVGILAQAGSISRIAEHLEPQGWSVEKNYSEGTLVAKRGSEQVDVRADRTGKVSSEGTNFQGNACSTVLDTFMELLGNYNVTNETSKVEPQQVIRTQI